MREADLVALQPREGDARLVQAFGHREPPCPASRGKTALAFDQRPGSAENARKTDQATAASESSRSQRSL